MLWEQAPKASSLSRLLTNSFHAHQKTNIGIAKMFLIARSVTIACFIWMLICIMFGGSSIGKDLLEDLVSNATPNTSNGIILVVTVFPVLIAGSVSSLIHRRPQQSTTSIRWDRVFRNYPAWAQQRLQRLIFGHGDGNFDLFAVLFLVIPCIIFTIESALRHLRDRNISLSSLYTHYSELDDVASEVTKTIGNTFGMMVMIVIPFFLIPVSKHGPILRLFGWNPVLAVRIHMWCGRLIIFGSTLHGAMHLLRWKYHLGEDIQTFLLPPRQCFTVSEGDEERFIPKCKTFECTCYDHFLYLTGVSAFGALFIITITSLDYVRRKFYRLFYMSHVLAGPLFFMAVIFHYNRGILYIAPSILYYVATSLPIFQERKSKSPHGNKIVSVDHLDFSGSTNGIISLTFKASNEAVAAHGPGTYVKLLSPSISNISHPFTINRVPGLENHLRIIFRASGKFTKKLAAQLTSDDPERFPIVHLDGFHGRPDRIGTLLQHDVAILIAGGIGITPFLSLLSDVLSLSGRDVDQNERSPVTKKIVLHWICRDLELIHYVRSEYFEPLLQHVKFGWCQVEIIIHQTNLSSLDSNNGTCNGSKQSYLKAETRNTEHLSQGVPFTPSRFTTASSSQRTDSLYRFLTFTAISWGGLSLIWTFVTNVQKADEIWQRIVAPLAVLSFAFMVSTVATRFIIGSDTIKLNCTAGRKMLNRESASQEISSSCTDEATHLLARVDTASTTLSSLDEEIPFGISMCTTSGRPSVRDLLKDVYDSNYPGVFSCGPPALIEDVHDVAEEICAFRGATKRSEVSPFIALYDEVFHT